MLRIFLAIKPTVAGNVYTLTLLINSTDKQNEVYAASCVLLAIVMKMKYASLFMRHFWYKGHHKNILFQDYKRHILPRLGESLATIRHVIHFLYLLFQVCSLFPPKPSVIPIKVVFQFFFIIQTRSLLIQGD